MSVSAATLATAQSLISGVTSHFTNQSAALQSAYQVIAPAIASYNASQATNYKAAANQTVYQAANQAAAQANTQAVVAAQTQAQAAAQWAAQVQAQQAAVQKAEQDTRQAALVKNAEKNVKYGTAERSAVQAEASVENGDWLSCLYPTGFEWNLPVGKITPAIGAPIYVSAVGDHLSASEYLSRYGIDPEAAYQALRSEAPVAPPKLVILAAPTKSQAEQAAISKGVVNLSTISQSQPYKTAKSLVGSITSQMTGAERSAYVEPIQIGNKIGMNISYWGEDQVNDVRDYLDDASITIDKDTKVTYDSSTDSYSATSSAVSSNADDSAKDADKTPSRVSDEEKLRQKDAISNAKDALLGGVKKVTDTLGLTSEFLATDWAEIDKLVKGQKVATGTKSLLNYGNAKDILMTEEAAYESQAAYDANNCVGPLCGAAEDITGAVAGAINISTQPIADALKPLIDALQRVIDTLNANLKLAQDTIINLPSTITGAIDKTYEKLTAFMKPYTDYISTTQKALLDLPNSIIDGIKGWIQPDIDWLKGEATKYYDKLMDMRDWAEAKFNEKLAPILDRINSLANLSMKDVEAYALGKFEELKSWMFAEWEKFKESPTGEVLKQLTALYNWIVAEVGKYLKAGTPTPEESAKMIIDTQKAMQPYVDEYIKTFCSNPLIEGP